MSVLKIESVEKFLCLLCADFLERLFHGERRARILGHGVGLHFGFSAKDRIDLGGRRVRGRISAGGCRCEPSFSHGPPQLKGEEIASLSQGQAGAMKPTVQGTEHPYTPCNSTQM